MADKRAAEDMDDDERRAYESFLRAYRREIGAWAMSRLALSAASVHNAARPDDLEQEGVWVRVVEGAGGIADGREVRRSMNGEASDDHLAAAHRHTFKVWRNNRKIDVAIVVRGPAGI
jgi:hypothetical protein